MYHANLNVNLMKKNVTYINSVITIIVNMSVIIQENIMCAEKFIFGILGHVLVKMVNI